MAETIWLRGEGGTVHEHDMPLSPPIASRLARGYLRQVNPDGTDIVAAPPAQPPAARAPKADWVAWAVKAHGVDPDQADAMTRTDLIDRYGLPPEK
jgi:hypothetical protein